MIREFRCIGIVLLLALVVCSGCNRFGEPPRYAFARFKKAVDGGDAAALSHEVSEESKKYLHSLETWVLRGKADQVERLPLFDRFLVLRVRMLHSEWNLEKWQAYGVEAESRKSDEIGEAWMPLIQNHFLNYTLGKVKYYEGIAGGPLLLGSREVDTRMRFFKEDVWKVDLVGFLNDEFDAMIVEYLGEDYNNRNRVNELLMAEFGSSFNRDLYRSRVDEEVSE